MEGGVVVYILLMLESAACQVRESGIVVYILLMLGPAACQVREWRVGMLCTFSSC